MICGVSCISLPCVWKQTPCSTRKCTLDHDCFRLRHGGGVVQRLFDALRCLTASPFQDQIGRRRAGVHRRSKLILLAEGQIADDADAAAVPAAAGMTVARGTTAAAVTWLGISTTVLPVALV